MIKLKKGDDIMRSDIILEKIWQESDEVAQEDRLFDIKVTAYNSCIKITNFEFEDFYEKIIINLSLCKRGKPE